MYDLIAQLYADDGIRFALWHIADTLHVSGIVAWTLDLAGFVLYEDGSVMPK